MLLQQVLNTFGPCISSSYPLYIYIYIIAMLLRSLLDSRALSSSSPQANVSGELRIDANLGVH